MICVLYSWIHPHCVLRTNTAENHPKDIQGGHSGHQRLLNCLYDARDNLPPPPPPPNRDDNCSGPHCCTLWASPATSHGPPVFREIKQFTLNGMHGPKTRWRLRWKDKALGGCYLPPSSSTSAHFLLVPCCSHIISSGRRHPYI